MRVSMSTLPFSKAFARFEARSRALDPATPVFLAFAWMLTAILTFYMGQFFVANRLDAQLMFNYLPWVMALAIPAFTMHGWAEDWRRGHAERLLTLPISLSKLAVTRFLVGWALIGLFLLGTWPMLATLWWLGQGAAGFAWGPDWGPILTGYLGTWLLGGVLLAASLMVAAGTRSFVSAFLGGFALNVILLAAGWSTLLTLTESFLSSVLPGLPFDAPLLALQRLSLLEFQRRFVVGLIDIRAVLFFLALTVLFLGLGYALLQRRAERGAAQPRWRGLNAVLGSTGAATLLLLAGQVWHQTLPGAFDATAEHRFTLSPATVQLLRNLPEPVILTVYDSRTNPDLPYPAYLTSQALTELLDQFTAAAPGKVQVVTRNPEAAMATELEAIRTGITPQPLPTSANFYLGVTANLGGRTAVIPALTPERRPYLEFDLASLINETNRTRRKTIAVLSAVNLRDTTYRPRFVTELQGLYTLNFLQPGDPVVPADTDMLLVMSAPFLPQESLYAIDQYMLRGGRTLMLLDPAMRSGADTALRAADRNADRMGFDHPADLLRFYGVGYDWNSVIGDVTQASPISQNATAAMQAQANETDALPRIGLGYTTYPFWLALTAGNVNKTLPFTTYVTGMTLPEAGSLQRGTMLPGLSYEAVLQTSPNARSVTRQEFDTLPAEVLTNRLSGTPRVHDLAALVQGRFQSAFTEVPESVRNYYRDYAASPEAATWPAFIAQPQRAGALLVVADADFPADEFALAAKATPDDSAAALEPVNDNLVFLFNAIQYLAGDGELLALRGKNMTPRTFTRLSDWLTELSGRYVLTEQKISTELFQLSTRLAELNAKVQGARNANLSLDPRDEQELATWQARDFELKQQLRQLRQSVRSDIQRLSHLLALVNILTMPLLLGLGYLIYLRRRRQRAHRTT